ncbi:hypothetical protein Hanom_Chr15g01376341 [Helianthus anomalus]
MGWYIPPETMIAPHSARPHRYGRHYGLGFLSSREMHNNGELKVSKKLIVERSC